MSRYRNEELLFNLFFVRRFLEDPVAATAIKSDFLGLSQSLTNLIGLVQARESKLPSDYFRALLSDPYELFDDQQFDQSNMINASTLASRCLILLMSKS